MKKRYLKMGDNVIASGPLRLIWNTDYNKIRIVDGIYGNPLMFRGKECQLDEYGPYIMVLNNEPEKDDD